MEDGAIKKGVEKGRMRAAVCTFAPPPPPILTAVSGLEDLLAAQNMLIDDWMERNCGKRRHVSFTGNEFRRWENGERSDCSKARTPISHLPESYHE
jgi:hypothetical protein